MEINMYLWITWTLSGFVILMSMIRVFEHKYPLKIILPIFVLGNLLYAFSKEWLYLHFQIDLPSFGLIIVTVHMIILLTCFYGSWIKKVIAMISYMIITGVIESFLILTLGKIFNKEGVWYLEKQNYLVLFLLDHILLFLCLNIIIGIWEKNKFEESGKGKGEWSFLIMMLAQVITFLPGMTHMLYGNENVFYNVIGLFMSFLLIFFLPAYMAETVKREEAEDQLLRLRQFCEIDKIHTELLEKRKAEISKLKHDFNNQLAVVYSLGARNDVENAKALLTELEELYK